MSDLEFTDITSTNNGLEDTAQASVKELAHFFKVLADPVRLQLLELLSDGQSRTSIEATLSLTDTQLEQHLQVLVDAGIVRLEGTGPNAQPQVDVDFLRALSAANKQFIRVFAEARTSRP